MLTRQITPLVFVLPAVGPKPRHQKKKNISILVSSIQQNKISIIILNPLFLILLFLSMTCHKTQRNSKFCIADGEKKEAKQKSKLSP